MWAHGCGFFGSLLWAFTKRIRQQETGKETWVQTSSTSDRLKLVNFPTLGHPHLGRRYRIPHGRKEAKLSLPEGARRLQSKATTAVAPASWCLRLREGFYCKPLVGKPDCTLKH